MRSTMDLFVCKMDTNFLVYEGSKKRTPAAMENGIKCSLGFHKNLKFVQGRINALQQSKIG